MNLFELFKKPKYTVPHCAEFLGRPVAPPGR